ncbi:hypothetical protein ADICYQ_3687 [Cyclobacterium qasimii M12-11B]|uniref:Uncharacterized protein n=1 Tax=Cyclobacterium qasimii M12-11B TaxID=641524 RepID=S7VBE6_9BACT|nr:hypothetical protein ADICYQ_3687 [Cyclobacterium qasimii M12-11B]
MFLFGNGLFNKTLLFSRFWLKPDPTISPYKWAEAHSY